MTHYIGLDAHSKTCTAVVINAAGKLVSQAKFDTSERNLIDFVKSFKSPRKLAFEEQNLAHWLFVTLKDQVDQLVVAHAAHLPGHRGPKNDLQDATRLADELRSDRLTSVYHEESKIWELRAIVYSYLDFTEDLVRTKNRYKAFLRARGIPATGDGVYTDNKVLEKITGDYEKFTAANLFYLLGELQETKDAYESKFSDLKTEWPAIKRLCSIPGIAAVRAATILGIVCSPQRFANKHKFWAYCKLVRYVDTSDGRIYGSRNTKGRPQLKAVFMGAATAVLQSNSGLRRYYDQLRQKGTAHNDAKKAVARRIAAIALAVMKSNKVYDDKFEEKRRRSKLVKT
jgi:transposase